MMAAPRLKLLEGAAPASVEGVASMKTLRAGSSEAEHAAALAFVVVPMVRRDLVPSHEPVQHRGAGLASEQSRGLSAELAARPVKAERHAPARVEQVLLEVSKRPS